MKKCTFLAQKLLPFNPELRPSLRQQLHHYKLRASNLTKLKKQPELKSKELNRNFQPINFLPKMSIMKTEFLVDIPVVKLTRTELYKNSKKN